MSGPSSAAVPSAGSQGGQAGRGALVPVAIHQRRQGLRPRPQRRCAAAPRSDPIRCGGPSRRRSRQRAGQTGLADARALRSPAPRSPAGGGVDEMPGQAGQPVVPADQPGRGGRRADHRGAAPGPAGRAWAQDGSWFKHRLLRAAAAPAPDRAELVGEHPPGPPQRVERLALALRPVEGDRSRPQRSRAADARSTSCSISPISRVVTAEGELGTEPVLGREQPQLAEPGRLGGQPGARPRQIRVRLPAPQPGGGPQQVSGVRGIGREDLVRRARPTARTRRRRPTRPPQGVTGRPGDQDPGRCPRGPVGFQDAPEVRDVGLHRGQHLRRRIVAPQFVDETGRPRRPCRRRRAAGRAARAASGRRVGPDPPSASRTSTGPNT